MLMTSESKRPPVRACCATRKWNFTDGCGIISLPLAKLIKRARNLPEIPSVCQIRLEAEVKLEDRSKKVVVCKGIVLTDFSLEGKPGKEELYEIRLRKSMMKLSIVTPKT